MATATANNKPIYSENTAFSVSQKLLSTAAAGVIVALPHVNSTAPVGQVLKPSQVRFTENIRTRTSIIGEQDKIIVSNQVDSINSSVVNLVIKGHKGVDNMNIVQTSDLLNKQRTLEVSANWISGILGVMLVGMLITWLMTSFGYAVFFLPPILAGLGVLLSHGIQLNKIDQLKNH